jgi:hypothetical protein
MRQVRCRTRPIAGPRKGETGTAPLPYAGGMAEPTAPQGPAMTDQALIEGTGANWRTWLELLGERGAAGLDHAAVARMLVREFEIDGWWAESIAARYERDRREDGARP